MSDLDQNSSKQAQSPNAGKSPATPVAWKLSGTKLVTSETDSAADKDLSSATPSIPSSAQDGAETPDKVTKAGQLLDKEIGGQKGLEPTRYGDWEKNGRCTDF